MGFESCFREKGPCRTGEGVAVEWKGVALARRQRREIVVES